MQYRSLPVTVDAVQFFSKLAEEGKYEGIAVRNTSIPQLQAEPAEWVVQVLGNYIILRDGDWVVTTHNTPTGKGFFVYTEEGFKNNYEPVCCGDTKACAG